MSNGIRHLSIVDKHNQLLGIITPKELQRLLQPLEPQEMYGVIETLKRQVGQFD